MPRRAPDPAETRQAVAALQPWLDGDSAEPARRDLATAVRSSLRSLAHTAPGSSVEVRVPPFAAVQCITGPEHTRGTPPNVIETDPRTWLLLATGRLTWQEAVETGSVTASGSRAELTHWLPVVRV